MQQEKREVALIAGVGAKGTGKTYQTLRVIKNYITAKPNKPARKVLVYDVNMEYSDATLRHHGCDFSIQPLALKDLPKWSKMNRPEARRILPVDEYGRTVDLERIVEILHEILSPYKGMRSGLLVLEDVNKYMIQTRATKIISAIVTARHLDLDIYLHLQSLKALTDRMWANVNYVRFHFQADNVELYAQKIPNYEIFKIAQCLISFKYHHMNNKRFFCYVGNMDLTIKGDFDKKDFLKACEDYIRSEPRVFRQAVHKYGEGGAIRRYTDELVTKYYDK